MSLVDCGARVVEQLGCYGCHRISGFDLAAPIGPELTGFAKKDVSTLDYGYAISDHHMQTTETFATLKEVGYDGWLMIEAFGLALPDLAAATKIWRSMFPDEEYLATNGLNFMKSRWEG